MSEDRGHYRAYIERRFSDESMELIRQANIIIHQYEAKGFSLTLRQLYYQFVARGMMDNSDKNYNRLGSVVSDGRMAGLISWLAIEDRTRNLKGLETWTSPAQAIEQVAKNYRIDRWANQAYRPEVWIEKEALAGVIGGICNDLHVDFFACRGYNSQSEQWRAGQRFANYIRKGQRPIVFHLGDHDPSGIDMTRDNQERLSLFAGIPVLVVRLALNFDQVERYKPPPNPAKMTDSRAKDYVDKYGDSSWELDALDPSFIAQLIEENVSRIRDEAKWSEALAEEAEQVDALNIAIESLGDQNG